MNKQQINSGEYIVMDVLKITSIPHISILSDNNSVTEQTQIIVSYAKDMANLLTEIYQQYKETYIHTGISFDLSMDLAWITEAVHNQPYKANIHLYIVVRAINRDSMLAERMVGDIMMLVSSTLDIDKYEYEHESVQSYFAALDNANKGGLQSIVKEERLEDLQNQYFPVCYAYDLFPIDYQDFSRIVRSCFDFIR